jgi:phycocyanobilin lyase beta subunit
LGNLHWHQLKTEQVPEAQAKGLEALLQVSQDDEWAIRYAAVVGLQALASSATATTGAIQGRFEQMLASEADSAVRSRVVLAQQRLQEGQASE